MSNSIRGPQRGQGAPFVMHLERVVRLIEMGQHFTIEFNPNSDVGMVMGDLVFNKGLRIDNGGVVMLTKDDQSFYALGLTLANYKRVWRCWQNGIPTDALRRGMKWG